MRAYLRKWLDVQLLRRLSEDAKNAIWEFLETDLDPRIEWLKNEAENRKEADEVIRQLVYLNRTFSEADRG